MTTPSLSCFDAGCRFTGTPTEYAEHLYHVHTEDPPDDGIVRTDRWEVVERLLHQGVRAASTGAPAPLLSVRNDCAFCHRERSAKDDNHAPECPYWDFFGSSG